MTNEELATQIKSGKTELLPELWNQVERLVSWKANKVMEAVEARQGYRSFDFDDLYNSGYIAMVNAISTYNPENGSFSNWLMFYIRREFQNVTGYRNGKSKSDAMNEAISVDTPVPGTEGDLTIGDMLESDIDIEEDVVNNIERQELHNNLETALKSLPDIQEKAIRLRYYAGKTLEQTGAELGFTSSRAGQIIRKALRTLHSGECLKLLEKYIDLHTDFYLRTSVLSQQSPVELLVIRRDEMRNNWIHREFDCLFDT